MRNMICIAVAAAFVLGGAAVTLDSASAKPLRNQNQGTSDGQACEATSGLNKGEKGVYTTDQYGDKYCSGAWGDTGCGKKGQPSRCKSAAHAGGGVYRPFPSATHQIPSGTWSAGNVSTVPGASSPVYDTRYPASTFGTTPVLKYRR